MTLLWFKAGNFLTIGEEEADYFILFDCNSYIEISLTCHKIHSLNVRISVAFSKSTDLCDHRHWLILESSSTQRLATTHTLSVSMDFPALDISCKWNHTVGGLSWLAFFHWVSCFRDPSTSCSTCQRFSPVDGGIIYHSMEMHFISPP